jgi:O-antigen/teichoic acid export membrane protein
LSKLAKNTLFYTIGSVLPQAAGFILLPIYAKFLSPEDFGIIGSMQALQTFLVIIFTLSIDKSVVRLYWDYNEIKRKEFLGTMTITIIIISSVMMLLFYMSRSFIGDIFEKINFYPFYFYTALTTFISSFQLIPKKYLLLSERSISFVLLSLLQFATNAVFTILLVVFFKNGAEGFILGSFYGVALTAPIFIYLTFKYVRFKFNKEFFKESLKFSLPMIPPFLTTWMVTWSNRIFIERFLSLESVGYYSLSVRIAGIISIFSAAFNNAYNPVFFRLANSSNQKAAVNTLRKYNYVYIIYVLLLCFSISLFSKDLILMFFDEKYIEIYYIIPLVSFGYFWSQLTGIVSRSFQQSKQMKLNMYISFSTGFINLILNYFLIDFFGIWGAIASLILTMLYSFWVSYFFTKRKCFFIPIDWQKIIPFVAISACIVYILNFTLELNLVFSLIFKAIIVLLVPLWIYFKYPDIVRELFNIKSSK